jgi:hypothetical protein
MTDQANQWREVAERADALALKLKLHVEQTSDDATVRDALGKLRTSMEDAFEAAGHAVHDEAVREDVREVGRLLTDALDTTFDRVGREVRELFQRRP